MLLAHALLCGWVLFPAKSNEKLLGKFSSISEFVQLKSGDTPSVLRWSSEGAKSLAGGLTYAYDPAFCADIIELFQERSASWLRLWDYVTCDTIKSSISLAFDTWSANHPDIHFIDVTDQCNASGLNYRVAASVCSSANCVRCSAAELMISTFRKDKENDHSGARVVPNEITTESPVNTLGQAAGGSFKYVELQYANDICWYLDSTFCSTFFSAQVRGVDVKQLMLALFVAVELLACSCAALFLLMLARSFFHALLATWDTDGDGLVEAMEAIGAGRSAVRALVEWATTGSLERASVLLENRSISALDAHVAVLHTLSQLNVLLASLVLTLIAFPPVFMATVFRPCWDCQDFKAASVHEIGHLLGLDHPDEWSSLNFATERAARNCSDEYAGVSLSSSFDADSVLRAQLVHAPKTCLTKDDLDGLQFLYPPGCDATRIDEPQCRTFEYNLGYLRLALALFAAVFVPVLLVLAVKLCAVLVLWCSNGLRQRGDALNTRQYQSLEKLNAKRAASGKVEPRPRPSEVE